RICSAERHDRTMFNQFLAQRERDRANYRSMSAPFSASELARTVADAHELLVILMLVKKARYLSFQRLPRIKGGMRVVEQFPLKLGRDGIPPHDHGRPTLCKTCCSSRAVSLGRIILSGLPAIHSAFS